MCEGQPSRSSRPPRVGERPQSQTDEFFLLTTPSFASTCSSFNLDHKPVNIQNRSDRAIPEKAAHLLHTKNVYITDIALSFKCTAWSSPVACCMTRSLLSRVWSFLFLVVAAQNPAVVPSSCQDKSRVVAFNYALIERPDCCSTADTIFCHLLRFLAHIRCT